MCSQTGTLGHEAGTRGHRLIRTQMVQAAVTVYSTPHRSGWRSKSAGMYSPAIGDFIELLVCHGENGIPSAIGSMTIQHTTVSLGRASTPAHLQPGQYNG